MGRTFSKEDREGVSQDRSLYCGAVQHANKSLPQTSNNPQSNKDVDIAILSDDHCLSFQTSLSVQNKFDDHVLKYLAESFDPCDTT